MTDHRNAITVVVPACNVGRYLSDCLDSLLAQSAWPGCRAIIVDDGSTDDTAAIADAYRARHPELTVIHQANAGPGAGAARNRGLDLVQTEFVLFLDGDDELAPSALQTLRDGLVTTGLDLAVGAVEQFPDPRSWIWSRYFEAGQSQPQAIEDVPLLVHDARTCNKLYRTSWLRSLGLRFAEGIHHQDTVVNVPAMLLAERFLLVGDVVHRYRKRAEGGSVMDSHYTRLDNYWDHLRVIEELDAIRPRVRPGRVALLQAFIARSFQGFTWRAPAVLPSERLPEFFDRAARVVRTLDPDVIGSATRDAHERAGYVTMLRDDFSSYRQLPELCERLVAADGQLYLDVPASTPEQRALLRTGRTRAQAIAARADRGGVSVQLLLRMVGIDRPDRAVTRTILVGYAGDTVAFEAPVTWGDPIGADCCGTARVPWASIAPGSYLLRLRFRTATGSAARWVRRPAVPDQLTRTPVATTALRAGPEARAVLELRPTLRTRLFRRLQVTRARRARQRARR